MMLASKRPAVLGRKCPSRTRRHTNGSDASAIEQGAARRGTGGLSGASRIAVVRALHGLGDMLCAVPALNALRRAHRTAHIALIGLPACGWMLDRFGSLLDALVPFPGFPGIPEQPLSPRALARFIVAARARPFDLAIQMHGSGTVSNAFTTLLGARTSAGLYEAAGTRPPGRFFPYPRHGSEVHRCLYLARAIECPADDDALSFPVTDADRATLREHVRLRELLDERFVCLHAGARDPARRWPPRRFAAVGDRLAAAGYRVVLTGTAAERAAADEVAAAMRRTALNAAGETSLGTAAALLERAALLVTNDTGISHLAAALGTPSVVVFLASDPERWAPLDRERHRPVVARGLTDRPFDGMRCSRDRIPQAQEILDEAFGLMTGAHGW